MPFIQPSRSDVHIDGPLTNISVAFMQNADNFVASRVFPNIPVSNQSDAYFTFPRGSFNRDDMEVRAPGSESAGANYELSTDTYSAPVRALHKDIADQVRANTDNPLSPDREATETRLMRSRPRNNQVTTESRPQRIPEISVGTE